MDSLNFIILKILSYVGLNTHTKIASGSMSNCSQISLEEALWNGQIQEMEVKVTEASQTS